VRESTDPERKAQYDKSRRAAKGDELRAYDRERAKLPHRKAAHNEDTRRRRARLMDATPETYDRTGVLSIYKLAQKISSLTGVEMHVDHITPLSCGGEHDVHNLQILAAKLNIKKGSDLSWEAPISRLKKNNKRYIMV
jgi:5-methylcytosine-specific restriction endonuclease McrA